MFLARLTATVLLIIFICTPLSYLHGSARHPSMAGSFYPGSRAELTEMVDTLLENAEDNKIDGRPVALISPHAGFVYSGPAAAEAYKILEHFPEIETAVIVGFKHRVDYRGIVVWADGGWKTPLGNVSINEEIAQLLVKSSDQIQHNEVLFGGEHSIETQIPFLQRVRPGIKIVPIQIGMQERDVIDQLSTVLAKILQDREDIILIASTDMTHYKTRSECHKIDSVSAKYIQDIDGRGLWYASQIGKAELCGTGAVSVVLRTARELGANQTKILKLSDSGDFSGDTTNVVSYLSAVVYRTENDTGESSSSTEIKLESERYLSDHQRGVLMDIARKSIEAHLNNDSMPQFEISDNLLVSPGAAFVTLNKDKKLRGCIGYTEPVMPLYQTISTCAVKAASADPRFSPLTPQEYEDVQLEISVLTPLKKIRDIEKIEVGKHGLMIQKGINRGLLLPQVATSYNWDRETFLSQTCRKAGLEPDCWQSGNCDIYIFSAEVFTEE